MFTFGEVEEIILTDAHDTVSITSVEAINATGETIDPFLILPGIKLPVRWFVNSLNPGIQISANAIGYITDILAMEWIRHFKLLTRPKVSGDVRLVLIRL